MYTNIYILFARDKFNFKESIKSIFKIPVIWFCNFVLAFNYFEFKIPKEFDFALQMGAYTSLTLQLIILGLIYTV